MPTWRANIHRILFLVFVLAISLSPATVAMAGPKIIVVSDNTDFDQPLIDFIKDAAGGVIDVSCTSGTFQNLDEAKIADLKGADLIVFGRSTNSERYDDPETTPAEPGFWNGLDRPLLILSPFFVRTQPGPSNPRWHWIDTPRYSGTGTPFNEIEVTAPNDPIFNGVEATIGFIQLFSNENTTLRHVPHNMTGNSGTVLATRPGDPEAPLLVRWADTTKPFHGGTAQRPGAVRFMFAVFDDANQNPPGQTPPAYVDQIALLTPEGKQLFKNILYDLLPALKKPE